ncbi:NAD-dependent epimerase/dehydratase family protein [archaeon]|jgi:UDP-glucose 4-epimerase|nr:NAD-dependent epimerase/dehydratase family protein [archaeon]MBT4373100.1 NAD-dependent epimerase/dehydratase family protein [archaeon]MBT4531445.1 NAD-dependent epimerase/dehydratase family protein [archaeon]MBT7001377.1 NAD-dependent epimerase/dehydratase family protein [archaeon]MBT7282137.1 NAD-dependent epimerase/dehydratase family protein [archaeon]
MGYELQEMSQKEVLITGGLGFIGSNLAKKCVKLGAKVTIFSLPGSSTDKIKDILEKVEIIYGEITEEEKINELVKGKDYLFHFAWQTDLKASMENPKKDLRADCEGIINILEACKKYNEKIKIIFASTVTIFGDVQKIPVNENFQNQPSSVYDLHKFFAENYLKMYYENYGINFSCLRLSNVFGIGQSIENHRRGVLNFMIGRALRGEDLTIYGEGDFIRDYCYIENYIEAFILAVQSEKTNGKVYVIGSGEGRTFNEVCDKIKEVVEKYLEKKVKITHIPFPEEEHKINKRNFISDFSKFKKDTGWTPQINFEEGLKKTIEFYRKK